MIESFGITFYAYGFLIGLGVWLAMEIALKYRGKIDPKKLELAMSWTILAGVIGARIYHVVDYWGRYYSQNLVRILYLWEGGLGIWGAVAGGLIGLVIFCFFNKVKFEEYVDPMVIGLPLAQTIGRIGNYINGELYGKNGEPLFFYEGILNLILFGVLLTIAKKRKAAGTLFGIYLIGYGLIRIALENLRPADAIWKLAGVPMAIWFGLAAGLGGLVIIFRRKQS